MTPSNLSLRHTMENSSKLLLVEFVSLSQKIEDRLKEFERKEGELQKREEELDEREKKIKEREHVIKEEAKNWRQSTINAFRQPMQQVRNSFCSLSSLCSF